MGLVVSTHCVPAPKITRPNPGPGGGPDVQGAVQGPDTWGGSRPPGGP